MKHVILGLAFVAAPSLASDYVVIQQVATVGASADHVWHQVGNFCAISKFLDVKCEYAAGKGGLGSVRRLNGVTLEPMIALTPYSYTYGQTEGGMKDFYYHGTLAVEPTGKRSSRIIYSLVYDQAGMASDEVRAAQRERITTRFRGAVDKIKAIAEAK